MLRRPMAGRSETIALIWLTLAVILREGGGTVFDTPAEGELFGVKSSSPFFSYDATNPNFR